MIAQKINKWLKGVMAAAMTLTVVTSCNDMWHQDYSDCPNGVYVKFKYDYNLQRADMFNDHVGQVTLYVFDDKGNYITQQTETNSALSSPLNDPNYVMHVENLQPGKYQFLALAGQNAYADQLQSGRAKFVRTELAKGDNIKKLEVNLDHQSRGDYDEVENHAMPLDTLWHGKMLESVEVSSSEAAYATIPLVRDTKKINVALRDLDSPQDMDVNDYTMTIEDHNARILWDNSLDESRKVVYTPHATWNTVDETEQGKIAHADFMTSRILKHDDYKQDGHLLIKSKETGNTLVNVSKTKDSTAITKAYTVENSEEYSYSAQEFLDRAYDYKLQFFIQGGKLKYCYITISVNVLSWSKRIQFEELN